MSQYVYHCPALTFERVLLKTRRKTVIDAGSMAATSRRARAATEHSHPNARQQKE
jgi:hypothetical protein